MHSHADGNGGVDQTNQQISVFELFVTVVPIAVEEKGEFIGRCSKSLIVDEKQRDFDVVVVVLVGH